MMNIQANKDPQENTKLDLTPVGQSSEVWTCKDLSLEEPDFHISVLNAPRIMGTYKIQIRGDTHYVEGYAVAEEDEHGTHMYSISKEEYMAKYGPPWLQASAHQVLSQKIQYQLRRLMLFYPSIHSSTIEALSKFSNLEEIIDSFIDDAQLDLPHCEYLMRHWYEKASGVRADNIFDVGRVVQTHIENCHLEEVLNSLRWMSEK